MHFVGIALSPEVKAKCRSVQLFSRCSGCAMDLSFLALVLFQIPLVAKHEAARFLFESRWLHLRVVIRWLKPIMSGCWQVSTRKILQSADMGNWLMSISDGTLADEHIGVQRLCVQPRA